MIVREVLEEWCSEVISEIRDNLATTGTNASGRTSEGLYHTIENDGDKYVIKIISGGRDYFESVERGRPAGNVPKGFTSIIRQWMDDKGISVGDDKDNARFAYFAANKIANYGTELYRNGGRDDIYTNVFTQKITELEKQLKIEILKDISNGE